MNEDLKIRAKMNEEFVLTPENSTPIVCAECENETFVPAYTYRRVSPIVHPTGKEQRYQVGVVICTVCKAIQLEK